MLERLTLPLKGLLGCCTASTTLIACWLLTVTTTILPIRDPDHVRMWTAIAAGFFVYAGVTLAVVVRGPKPALIRMLSVLSLGALAFGGVAIRAMYVSVTTGAHFEGYQLLMGLAIAGHGVCALAYAAAGRSNSGSRPTTA